MTTGAGSGPTRSTVRVRGVTMVGELLLILALALLPLIWRWAAGSGGVPAGDAWAYERIARTFHETGEIALVGWNDLSLVGMVVLADLWAAVVGFGSTQLHLLGALMGAASLLALREILRASGVGVEHRWLPLLVGGTCLGFVGVSGTFLSDLFSITGPLWGLVLVVRLVDPDAAPGRAGLWIAAASAGALFAAGFTVRQNAAAAAAAGVVLLWRERRRLGLAWIVTGAAFAVIAAPFYMWRGTLEHGGEVMLAVHPRSALASAIAVYVTLGLVALPMLVRRRVGRPDPRVVAICGVPVVLVALSGIVDPLAPLAQKDSLVAGFLDIGGVVGWTIALVAAVAAAWSWVILLSTTTLTDVRENPLLLAAAVASAAELAAALSTGNFYARYSILGGFLLVAALAVPSVATEPWTTAPRRSPTWIALAALATGSFWLLDASGAAVGAIDEAGEVAACAGIPPEHLDGGFVWNGMHHRGLASATFDAVPADDGLPPTEEQTVFVGLVRQAVLVADRPADDAHPFGPFRSTGLLPFNSEERWMVADPDLHSDLARCLP